MSSAALSPWSSQSRRRPACCSRSTTPLRRGRPWGSVYYLDTQIPLGFWVRGLHHWGASAMMVLLVLHLGQVFLYGAYRPPRELGWWSGLLLLGLTMAFSLTGYLLPWDQRGYWATRVVTNLMGAMPIFGRSLQALLVGGNGFGNLTLTRFFGFHVFFLPAALALTLGPARRLLSPPGRDAPLVARRGRAARQDGAVLAAPAHLRPPGRSAGRRRRGGRHPLAPWCAVAAARGSGLELRRPPRVVLPVALRAPEALPRELGRGVGCSP